MIIRKKNKPKNYVSLKKLICDWTDKKKYLIHYRMIKFYVRHGMVVEKVHEVISLTQSKWLEKYITILHENEMLPRANKKIFLQIDNQRSFL